MSCLGPFRRGGRRKEGVIAQRHYEVSREEEKEETVFAQDWERGGVTGLPNPWKKNKWPTFGGKMPFSANLQN